MVLVVFFFFSSRRRHTRSCLVSWARRCVQETAYRVTQLYETGAAIYVYFAFVYYGLQDPVRVYSEVEDAARDEIMKCGGSISHHHGVGKLRKKFLPRSIGDTGIKALEGVKKVFDPNNIFANGSFTEQLLSLIHI
eukprot:TRINITY_DN1004_c0_g2_i10.p2 TRINITY_DN1004_c0_g2~~TRINITY_DN1004_c0_g2_i10.p2  ORF type:complete len:136 (-),score=53.87 TRINITY_DN1004_c0_g2_i10:62-469(-)